MENNTHVYAALLLVVLLLVHITILRPFIPLLMIKLKLGDQACLRFRPISGIFSYYKDSLKLRNDDHAFLVDIARTQPKVKIILSNILIQPLIIFIDHTYVKRIMIYHEQYNKFIVSPDTRLIQKGLFYTKGSKWRKQRQQLTKSFSFESLGSMVPKINQIVKKSLKDIEEPFKSLDVLSNLTGQIVLKKFFGSDMEDVILNGNSIQLETSELIAELCLLWRTNILFQIGFKLFGQKIWNIFPGKQASELHSRVNGLLDITGRIIQARLERKREFYELSQKDDHSDILDLYLHQYVHQKESDQTQLTFDEITQQFMTFFQAGTDSTTYIVSVMLLQLGKDQESQQEIREEIINLLGDRDVSQKNLSELPKISAFLKECFRMRNPNFSLFSRLVSEDHYIKDVYVKKGWYVRNDQIAQMVRQEYIDNGSVFDWKRWLDKDPIKCVEDQVYVFTPFSAGGRICIGQHLAQMEIKIIICHFLRQFQIYVSSKTEIKWSTKFLYSFSPDTAIELKRI